MGDVVRAGSKDRPRFYIRFTDHDGKRVQRAAKGAQTLAEARAVLAAAELRVTQGKVGIAQPTPPSPEEVARATVTLRELAGRFLGDVEDVPGYAPPRIKSIANYRGDARSALNVRILPTLGDRPAATIRLADVERLRDALLEEKRAAATVVHTLAVLSKVYSWARRAGHVDCANPVQGVERPRPNATIDYLDRAEVARLLAKVDEMALASPSFTHTARVRAPMVATAVYTGMRRGELLGLRWRDVHLDAGRIDVMHSYRLAPKSGKARHLPIDPDLARVLRLWKEACPPTDDGLVFPMQGDGPRGRWHMGDEQDTLGLADLLQAAGCHEAVDGKPWHLLRHTFASHAVMSGVSIYELQRLLGHATPAMTARYAHLAPDHLAGAVARISFAAPAPTGVASMDEERRKRAGERVSV